MSSSKNGQKAVKDLRSALDETFSYLERLAASAEGDHHQFTEQPYDDKSIVFIHTTLRHGLMPSNVDEAVSSLRSIESDIKRITAKVDEEFMRTTKLYNLSINQKPSSTNDSPRSAAMMTIRDKLIQILKPRKSRRIRTRDGDGSSKGEIISVIAPHTKEAQRSSSYNVPTISLLLQLPPELLILIITALHDDFLQDLARGTNTLPALRL